MNPTEVLRSAPLSLQQEREWMMATLAPDNLFDNIPPVALRLRGIVDAAALQRALDWTVARQEILRTTFRADDGCPVQLVRRDGPARLRFYDVSGSVDRSERESAALDILRADAVARFDLLEGPLFRTGLIRLSGDDHVVFVTMHHIVTDLWSMRVFFSDWASSYSMEVSGRPAPAPLGGMQYADYAVWQRERLQGETLDRELNYWARHLEGYAGTVLPTDRVRGSAVCHDGGVVAIDLPSDLAQRVRDVSVAERVTPFMTLLTAYTATLSSYTGQRDIVVGSPTANRVSRQTEQLVGHFAHTIALRTRLADNASLEEVRAQVRGACFDAHSWAALPFWRIARHLNLGPAAIVMFQMQSVPLRFAPFGGVHPEPFECTGVSLYGSGIAPTRQFDLCCEAWDLGSTYRLVLSYRSDCFSRQAVDGIARRLQRVIDISVSDPAMTVGELMCNPISIPSSASRDAPRSPHVRQLGLH